MLNLKKNYTLCLCCCITILVIIIIVFFLKSNNEKVTIENTMVRNKYNSLVSKVTFGIEFSGFYTY